jgi:hypothetical protein
VLAVIERIAAVLHVEAGGEDAAQEARVMAPDSRAGTRGLSMARLIHVPCEDV